MKREELRIGNLFKDSNGVIRQLDEKWFVQILNNKRNIQIYPVELTIEWLLKFGIKKIENSYNDGFEYKIQGIGVGSFEDNGFIIYYNAEYAMIPLKHVHQLQNLYFALTGEELKY